MNVPIPRLWNGLVASVTARITFYLNGIDAIIFDLLALSPSILPTIDDEQVSESDSSHPLSICSLHVILTLPNLPLSPALKTHLYG